jgi:hypothetical protein
MEPNDKDTNIIYNNDFCYITEDGRLYQKANRFFGERHIADIDTSDIDAALKGYRDAYTELRDQVKGELLKAGSREDIDRLSDNIRQSEAIGDYNSIALQLEKTKAAFASGQDADDSADELAPGRKPVDQESRPLRSEPTQEATSKPTDEPDKLNNTDQTSGQESDANVPKAESESSGSTTDQQPDDYPNPQPELQPGSSDKGKSEEKDSPVVSERTEDQPDTSGDTSELPDDESRKPDNITEQTGEHTDISDPESEKTDQISEQPNRKSAITETAPEQTAETSDSSKKNRGTESPVHTGETAENVTGEGKPPTLPEQYYLDLVEKAREYSRQKEWALIPQLFASVYDSWNEGPELDDARKNELRNEVDNALAVFNERKSVHYDQLKEKRSRNVDQRVQLLARLEKIVELNRWHAIGEVNSIRRKWEEIRQLPSADTVRDQNESFQKLLDEFDKNRVDYLVGLRETEEENLAGKLMILDKMDQIVARTGPEVDNWDNMEQEMNELTHQWRKIGHVPKEKEDEVWTRYKAVKDQYYSARAEHDEVFRKELEKNVKIRKRLIQKATELVEQKDLARGVHLINKLHSDWKKAGMVPKEESDRLWDEFKSATEAFNKLKSENIDVIREQENENYQAKVALCERAEALSEAENWKTATDEMTGLMAEWKKIGPVPRKKTNAVWIRFKRAMDVFYKKRRSFFKEARTEQKENLDKKREVIGRISALKELEDAGEVIEKVRELQEEFKSIGFVPLKMKNKIWLQYKTALDEIYDWARSSKKAVPSPSGSERSPAARQNASDRPDKKAQQEVFRLRRECEELRNTIRTYGDSMTYIKPNKKGIELREEIQKNIDEAENKLKEKLGKIEELSSDS